MNFKFLDKTPHHFSLKNGEGYIGIPELLVIMAIIVILTVVALINYPAAKKQLALQRSASQMAQDIRRVQEMALAAEEVGGAIPEGGYGIYLKKVPIPQIHKSYVLFADIDNNHKCDGCNNDPPSGEAIVPPGRIYFEEGIKIKELDNPHVNIIFIPPDPTTYFTDADGLDLSLDQVSIVISLLEDETKTKTIRVNKAGLIYVE